jgi:hypothetical protein
MSNLFPLTARIQGTLESANPSGVRIGVLGIRATPSAAFTTLSPLAK